MTIQDLKANRDLIIATITEEAGAENVPAVMAQMLKGLDCCDTLEELISEGIYFALEYEDRPEKSKLAAIMSGIANHYEDKGYKFNAITSTWEK